VQAWVSTSHSSLNGASPGSRSTLRRFGLRLLTALLHVLHPLARLRGRFLNGARAGVRGRRPSFPWPKTRARWTEQWSAPEERLKSVEEALRDAGAKVRRGGDWDLWDLEVEGGAFGTARLIIAVEDHGSGKQLVRSRWWPSVSATGLALALVLSPLAVAATLDGARPAAPILGAVATWVLLRAGLQCGAAAAAIEHSLRERGGG